MVCSQKHGFSALTLAVAERNKLILFSCTKKGKGEKDLLHFKTDGNKYNVVYMLSKTE